MKVKRFILLIAAVFLFPMIEAVLPSARIHAATGDNNTPAPGGTESLNALQTARRGGDEGGDEYYDLLILGIDRRPGQKVGRSDVILIVHCEPDHVSLFSIPRDTMALVRGRSDKINHAYAYGGIRLSIATIEYFLKFKVDNYITLDFESFLKTIDAIKLLTDDGRLIGAENLLVSGDNLLKWLRFRYFEGSDRRRAQRHQLFIKRILEYTQGMYTDQRALFEQCVKGGLKIAESDLTYEHIAQLHEAYKNFDIENNIERYVLPGYGTTRYKDNPNITAKRYEAEHMPDFSDITNDPNLSAQEKAKKKRAAQNKWRKENNALSFYIPKYHWSLATYVHFYRSKGISMNYVEEDVLRK